MNREDTQHVLLVMGNGFDIACELHTKYNDFFKFRYGKEKGKEDEFDSALSPIVDELLNLAKSGKPSNGSVKNGPEEEIRQGLVKNKIAHFTNWDIIFLTLYMKLKRNHKSPNNSDSINWNSIEWNSIEEIIYEVLSINFGSDTKKTRLTYQSEEDKESVENLIRYVFKLCNKDSESSIKDELHTFERDFADYIEMQVDTNQEDYYSNAKRLIKKIVANQQNIVLDVLNFNYSLDQDFLPEFREENNIKINSWNNIHGRARKTYKDYTPPIFGIDLHDILSTKDKYYVLNHDPRTIFTKSSRLLENAINTVKEENVEMSKHQDRIIFFGHSLSSADYSYFESIFDKYNIYDSESKVTLEFYFDSHGNKNYDYKKRMRGAIKNVVNLLTTYGRTLGKEKHGENIVSRMKLENRLKILKTPKF